MGAAVPWIITGIGAASSVASTLASGAQQRRQASMARAQAEAAAAQHDAQAKTAEAQARMQQEERDRQRIQMRREHADAQARNRVMLAGGNVDSATGSAVDVALGNANRFAADIGQNRYAAAVDAWSARNTVASLQASAQNQRNAADYYGSAANSMGSTLLLAGLNGLAAGASTYTMLGGTWPWQGAAKNAAGAAGAAGSDVLGGLKTRTQLW